MIRRGRCEDGFTLLELLIAMTVLGVLTSLLASGIGFGARVWERERAALERTADLQIAQDLIRRTLGQAWPLIASGGGNASGTAFEGSDDALHFVGPAPTQGLAGGIYSYGLETRTERHGLRLVLTWRLRPPEQEPRRQRTSNVAPEGQAKLQAGDEVVLVDRLAGVRFSFFGPDEQGAPARWRDRWEAGGRLPALVRLELTFPRGDPRVWPELTVAPMVTAAPGV